MRGGGTYKHATDIERKQHEEIVVRCGRKELISMISYQNYIPRTYKIILGDVVPCNLLTCQ